jgi:hypothetical protein
VQESLGAIDGPEARQSLASVGVKGMLAGNVVAYTVASADGGADGDEPVL